MKAIYDRIAALIQKGHGSRLIAVLVPPRMPLLRAIPELRRYLRVHGIITSAVHVKEFSSLWEAVDSVEGVPRTLVVHGLEALPISERESFLRSSNFGRTRLRELSVPVILVLGTETWSWMGMELPDLARWADGPFVLNSRPRKQSMFNTLWVSERDPVFHALPLSTPRVAKDSRSSSRTALFASQAIDIMSVLFGDLNDCRNVDLRTPFEKWVTKGGVMVMGGSPAVGLSRLANYLEQQVRARKREVSHMGTVWLERPNRTISAPTTYELERWLEARKTDTILADRSFCEIAPSALTRKKMTGLVLGPSRSVLENPEPGVQALYVPPVQVVTPSNMPHHPGVEAMVRMVYLDIEQQSDLSLSSGISDFYLSNLAFASGGLPGLLWQMIAETEQRVDRLGLHNLSQEQILKSVVQDTAQVMIQSTDSERVEYAIRYNRLDFELERQGAVLFYVVDGELRTLRHPLLTLAEKGAELPFG